MLSILSVTCTISKAAAFLMICTYSPPTSELDAHAGAFARESGKVTVEEIRSIVPMSFSELGWERFKGGTIGLCYYPMFGNKGKIEIDTNFWVQASETKRRGLMWHEFGHCVCGLGHSVEIEQLEPNWLIKFLHRLGVKTARNRGFYLNDGCPKSLMHPLLPSEECLEKHWESYKSQIIKSCRPFGLYKILNIFEN
jgi:hypothetical protein